MRENKRLYTNGEITVFWNYDLCEHVSTCFIELPRVFHPRRKPWIDLSYATTERILEVIEACPTKALCFKWNDETKNQAESSKKCIKNETDLDLESYQNNDPEIIKDKAIFRIMKNGPIVVKGNFQLFDKDKNIIKTLKVISLCRCGVSNKMPFCDGAHFKINFTDIELDEFNS